jgi:hypothetical protein
LGLRGGIAREDCVLFLPDVVEPCGCVSPPPTDAPYQCNLCGDSDQVIENPDGVIPDLPTLGDVSCAQLEQFALQDLIPQGLCNEQLFNIVSTNCGCTFQ